MLNKKKRERLWQVVTVIQARIHGIRYKTIDEYMRASEDVAHAEEILEVLTKLSYFVSHLAVLVTQDEQARVAYRIKQQEGHDHDAYLIAKHWPWNDTNHDWWAHRREL